MEYASFYGGRRGTPFVIVKSYPDIPTMINFFAQGDDYKQVNYDEYVIINAYKRDHPDNGKIFRRGYDIYSGRTIICTCAKDPATNTIRFNQPKSWYLDKTTVYELNTTYDAKGAKYIGKIQGPPGIAPILKLMTYKGATEKYDQQYQEARKSIGSFTVAKGDLVSGKTNHQIKWIVANISEENSELDRAYAYVGFKIPYPVIEFSAIKVTQYDKDGNYTQKVPQPVFTGDLKEKPFYHPWQLSIPKGIKGDCLKNFKVITPTKTDKIYDLNYYLETGKKKIYDGFDNDISYQSYKDTSGKTWPARQILVYTEIVYDLKQAGQKTCFYVADYDVITSMDIQADGTVNIFFTHSDPIKYPKMLKWIKRITLNKSKDGKSIQPGHFVIQYNNDNYNGTLVSEYDLDWVNNIILQSDGQIKQEFTGKRPSEYITDKKDYPTGQLDQENYLRLRWIQDVVVDQYGTLTVTYNDKNREGEKNQAVFERKIKWLENFNVDGETGQVVYKFNNEDQAKTTTLLYPVDVYLQQDSTQISSADVSAAKEGTGDQSIYVKYTNTPEGDPGKKISPPINYILATDITPDKHLIVLYADKAKRDLFISNARSSKTAGGYQGKEIAYMFYPPGVIDDEVYYNINRNDQYGSWKETVQVQGVQVTQDAYNYEGWLDLGITSIPSGILIGGDIPSQTISNWIDANQSLIIQSEEDRIAAMVQYLNETYPAGLGRKQGDQGPYLSPSRSDVTITNTFLLDKIITIGDETKYFFGFDYQILQRANTDPIEYYFKGWFLIGTLTQNPFVVEEEANAASALNKIVTGGLWFIVGDMEDLYGEQQEQENSQSGS